MPGGRGKKDSDKACIQFFTNPAGCQYGDRCRFSHHDPGVNTGTGWLDHDDRPDDVCGGDDKVKIVLHCGGIERGGIPFVTEQTLYVGNGGGVDLYDPNSRLRDPDTGLSAAAEDPETGCIYSLHHTGTKRDHAERVAGR